MHDQGISFGLLGPLHVRDGGGERPIRSAHQRILIAALLLRAGRLASTDELVELVWVEDAPSRPRQALQNHVMRVRQVLGPQVAERLRTQPAGYILHIEPEELDIDRFRQLRERGQAAAAVGDWQGARVRLGAALGLWRGEPLTDIASPSLQHEYCEALRQEHLVVREAHIDAGLRLGLFTETVGELRMLTAAHPWRERLHGRLMIALYGDGRQTEALAVFRDFRNAVIEELGVEPDAELQQLHQRVLAQDPVSALLDRVGEASRPLRADGAGARTTGQADAALDGSEPGSTEPGATKSGLTEPGTAWSAALRPGGGRPGFRRRSAILAGVATSCTVLVAVFSAGVLLGRSQIAEPGKSPNTAASSEVEDPLPPVQKVSPDGSVRYVGRAGSDAQILSSTAVDVPIDTPVSAGDTVVVSLGLTGTGPGTVTVTDTAGNTYTKVGDVVDTYWHRTMIYVAFGVKPLKTADRINATYPRSSKYHIAVDEFRGVTSVAASAGDSNVYEQNSTSFTTSKTQLWCRSGDLLIAALATNSTGTAPKFSTGWQTLPILKLSSYRLTTAYEFVTGDGKCAATGLTRGQWETTAVVFHR